MSNRLADESSPYLLQHKDNPVDWYPWGTEALELAQVTDKPIFLSVGYSACHWCHVMEHESFENPAIARLLNDNFVSIKVDREERPDLDQIYMNAVMALRNGQGGWPLSVFLTPQQEVFFGGTYWPPTSRVGMPGFDHVLHSVLDAFKNRREQVNEQSAQITAWLNQQDPVDGQFALNESVLVEGVRALHRNFDFENGGFGGAPKFPHCMDLSLLIRMAGTLPDDAPFDRDVLLDMVRINLKKMAYGGIFDHLAGGFARYSVDEYWLVPHFEKMLYDNALLSCVYLDMYDATGDEFYASITRKTLDYLLGYMTDEEGCFYSTEDADSEGEEGKFYVWSKSEILNVLGADVGQRFCELYGVTESGNFEGSNILNMKDSYQEFADQHKITKQDLRDEMRNARQQLLDVRDQRVRPGKDDKVLVSWNALAISAFSKAAILLNEPKYHQAARAAVEFIFANMLRDDGRLLHTWRHGVAKIDAYLDDHSYLINALLDLYRVDFDPELIARAVNLANMTIEHFEDSQGGFFFIADDQEKLIARQKNFQDGSVPAGNSMAALALLRLGCLTGDSDFLEKADQTIKASAALLKRSPLASGQMLIAIHEAIFEKTTMVLAANSEDDQEQFRKRFVSARPRNCELVCRPGFDAKQFPSMPILNDKLAIDGQTTLYICQGGTCAAPIVGLQDALNAIAEMG